MTYRTYKAQVAHETIIRYIKDIVDKQSVIKVIDRLTFTSLTETSINGHSHLIDAIHLSSVMSDVNVKGKINFLIDTILKKAQSFGREAILFLLKKPCYGGYTPLHSLLMQAHKENFSHFLAVIHYWINKQYLNSQDYKELLFFRNQKGMTAIHILLRREDRENFKAYFNEIHASIHKGIISSRDYVDFLLPLNPQATFLQDINLTSSVNFAVLLEELNYLVAQQWLTIKKFYGLLNVLDTNGFSLLHTIIKLDKLPNIKLFFAELKNAAENRWFNSKELSDILLTNTPRGFSIIHLVVFYCQVEAIQVVLTFLNDCIQAKWITKTTFQSLYLQHNQTGLTALASAIKTGSLEVVKLLIENIQSASLKHWLSVSQFDKLFLQASSTGTTLLHLILLSEKPEMVEEFFLALKKGLSMGYLREADLTLLFQRQANNGHTPLQEALESNSFSKVKVLLKMLKECCPTDIYLKILDQKVNGSLLVCNGQGKEAEKINNLLIKEREISLDQKLPSQTSALTRFFKPKLKLISIQDTITDRPGESLIKIEKS